MAREDNRAASAAGEGSGGRQARPRRRARRVADVDYDRSADTPVRRGPAGGIENFDGDRAVVFEDDAADQLTGLEFYENERPPHHG